MSVDLPQLILHLRGDEPQAATLSFGVPACSDRPCGGGRDGEPSMLSHVLGFCLEVQMTAEVGGRKVMRHVAKLRIVDPKRWRFGNRYADQAEIEQIAQQHRALRDAGIEIEYV